MTGKAAVITGAAHGIGKATAQLFAEEGAVLALGDIDRDAIEAVANQLRAQGTEVLAVAGDLTAEDGAKSLMQQTLETYDCIDVLINNLGGARTGNIWELPTETWDEVIALNLRSMFLCTKHAAAAMVGRNRGAIVCLSSGAREGTPWSAYYAGNAPYSTAQGWGPWLHSRRGDGTRRAWRAHQCGCSWPDRYREGRRELASLE